MSESTETGTREAEGTQPAAADTETAPAPEGDAPAPETGTAAPAEDWRERWLRAEADLQNFRRRSARDREDAVRFAEERVLIEMVGVLDDLERALAAASDEAAAPWRQGIELTAQRMRDALARFGVEPIAALGQPFDPASHEAMLEMDAPAGVEPGAVAQEVLRGYRRGERTLRPARVIVARRSQDAG